MPYYFAKVIFTPFFNGGKPYTAYCNFLPGKVLNIKHTANDCGYPSFDIQEDKTPFEELQKMDEVRGVLMLEGGNDFNYVAKGCDLSKDDPTEVKVKSEPKPITKETVFINSRTIPPPPWMTTSLYKAKLDEVGKMSDELFGDDNENK
jgi:hypothetical protein